MRITIIGAGNVGATLGHGLARAGHTIAYALRDPSDPKYAPLRSHALLTTIREGVVQADTVLLATPWGAAEDALAAAGDFAGRPLLDATNPIGPGLQLTLGHSDSGAEQIARWAESARVVKIFNTTGRENMAAPAYGGAKSLMLACGDDDDARAIALDLARELGFEALDFGELRQARLLEPLAMVWIRLSIVLGRDFALGLLRRDGATSRDERG